MCLILFSLFWRKTNIIWGVGLQKTPSLIGTKKNSRSPARSSRRALGYMATDSEFWPHQSPGFTLLLPVPPTLIYLEGALIYLGTYEIAYRDSLVLTSRLSNMLLNFG